MSQVSDNTPSPPPSPHLENPTPTSSKHETLKKTKTNKKKQPTTSMVTAHSPFPCFSVLTQYWPGGHWEVMAWKERLKCPTWDRVEQVTQCFNNLWFWTKDVNRLQWTKAKSHHSMLSRVHKSISFHRHSFNTTYKNKFHYSNSWSFQKIAIILPKFVLIKREI